MITKEMNIMEAIQKYPAVVAVLQELGLGCIGCIAASGESLEQGLAAHGIDIDAAVAKMNEAIKED